MCVCVCVCVCVMDACTHCNVIRFTCTLKIVLLAQLGGSPKMHCNVYKSYYRYIHACLIRTCAVTETFTKSIRLASRKVW